MQLNTSLIALSVLVSAVMAATPTSTAGPGEATTTGGPSTSSTNSGVGGGYTDSHGGGYGNGTTTTVTKTVTYCGPPSSTPSCPPLNWTIWLRRMWNAQTLGHFYSTYGPEVAQFGTQGYVEETPQGHIYPTQVPGTVPLWRCASNTGTKQLYFYTADQGEFTAMQAQGCQIMPEPQVDKGIGYLYTTLTCGAVPFYRLYSASRVDYLYTVNETERNIYLNNNLYVDQGIAGYIIPQP